MGRRLQMPVESSWGSMGMARSGKVDAGAAKARFEVEVGACADILGNIGDVDLEFVSAIGAFRDEDRIVKVFSGFAVDGDDGKSAEVAAAIDFNVIEKGDGSRFGQHFIGEDARKLMLADHHFHVDAEVVGIAEHFDDATDGRTRWRGPACDFDIDDDAFEIVVNARPLRPRCRGRDAEWLVRRLAATLDRKE